MYRRRGGLNARAAHKVQAPQGGQLAPQGGQLAPQGGQGGQAAPPGAQPQPQDGTLQPQQVRSYFAIDIHPLLQNWQRSMTGLLFHRSIQSLHCI